MPIYYASCWAAKAFTLPTCFPVTDWVMVIRCLLHPAVARDELRVLQRWREVMQQIVSRFKFAGPSSLHPPVGAAQYPPRASPEIANRIHSQSTRTTTCR